MWQNLLALSRNAQLPLLPSPLVRIWPRNETQLPGPIKCFCAPCRQISAKTAHQKARNRDKAKFVTKLRTVLL